MSAGMTRRLRLATAAIAAFAVSALAGPAWGQALTARELGFEELPRIRNVQWGAAYESQRQAIAYVREVASAPSSPGLDQNAVNSVNVQMGACNGGLSNYWIDAYSCVAEGALVLAQYSQEEKDQNYQRAIYASYVAARLAMASPSQRRRPQRAVATWRQRAAEANQLLGNALMGRYHLSGGNAVQYADYAIRAYQTSVSAEYGEENHARYVALARALADRGRGTPEAYDAYGRLLALPASPSFPTQDRVSALVARARLASNEVDRQRLLREARGLGAENAEVNVEIGRFLRASGNSTEAWSLFDTASRMPASSGPINYSLEAFYYLSLIDADRTPPNWGDVFRNANRAGASQRHYRRQACLSHIARGGEDYSGADVLSDDAVGIVCTGSDGPEGQLLQGMYWLRRAQYVPNISVRANRDRWNDYVDRAMRAFSQGRALASTPAAANEPVDWEGKLDPYAQNRAAAAPGMLTIGEALQFGETAVIYVARSCAGARPSGAAANFFWRYRALAGERGCSP